MLNLKAIEKAYIILVDGLGIIYAIKQHDHFVSSFSEASIYSKLEDATEAKETIYAKYINLYPEYKNYRIVAIKIKLTGSL